MLKKFFLLYLSRGANGIIETRLRVHMPMKTTTVPTHTSIPVAIIKALEFEMSIHIQNRCELYCVYSREDVNFL